MNAQSCFYPYIGFKLIKTITFLSLYAHKNT
jgi:hypothetical protein